MTDEVLTNSRAIMRDSSGRIYQERWYFVSEMSCARGHRRYPLDFCVSRMRTFEISNPITHTLTVCTVKTHICKLSPYHESVNTIYLPDVAASRDLENGAGVQTAESIGHKRISGIDTDGYRVKSTFKPGTFGNNSEMTTTREFWYSPELGINLSSTLRSPISGLQVYTALFVKRTDPDPNVFMVPQGYKIEDKHAPAQP